MGNLECAGETCRPRLKLDLSFLICSYSAQNVYEARLPASFYFTYSLFDFKDNVVSSLDNISFFFCFFRHDSFLFITIKLSSSQMNKYINNK